MSRNGWHFIQTALMTAEDQNLIQN